MVCTVLDIPHFAFSLHWRYEQETGPSSSLGVDFFIFLKKNFVGDTRLSVLFNINSIQISTYSRIT